MWCKLCQKYGWRRELSKRVVWHDSANDGYCVFHAPEGMKRDKNDRPVSPGEFKTLLGAHINVELIKSKGKFCNVAGAIIPCDLYLSEIALDKVVLPIGFQHVKFCGSVRGNGLHIQNGLFDGCIFEKDVDFRNSTFEIGASFLKVKFNEVALFSKAKFPKGGLFIASEFKNAAWFNECEFGDHVIFHSVVAGNAAIRMHDITKESLQWLQFSRLEVRIFSFSGCTDWPNNFGFESPEESTDKKREELYRAMKQRAAEAHDQLQVSDWHFREKLMQLKQLLNNKRSNDLLEELEDSEKSLGARAWAWLKLLALPPYLPKCTLTGLYYVSSGFGERAVRAGVVLLALVASLFALHIIPQPLDWNALWGSTAANATMATIPVAKDIPGDGWVKVGRGFGYSLVVAQAALFGRAVSNRFCR